MFRIKTAIQTPKNLTKNNVKKFEKGLKMKWNFLFGKKQKTKKEQQVTESFNSANGSSEAVKKFVNSLKNNPTLFMPKTREQKIIDNMHIYCLGLNSSLEKAMAPDSSTLAWKIPWMEEPGRLQSVGLHVRHD